MATEAHMKEREKEDKLLDEPVNKALSELYPEWKDEPRADQPFETIMSLGGKDTKNLASNVDVEKVKDDGEDNAEPIESDSFLGSSSVDKVAREINRTAPKDYDAQILDQMKDTSVNESLGENKLEDQHDEVAATNQSSSGGNQNSSFKNENGGTMTKKTGFKCYQNDAESPETTSGQHTGVAVCASNLTENRNTKKESFEEDVREMSIQDIGDHESEMPSLVIVIDPKATKPNDSWVNDKNEKEMPCDRTENFNTSTKKGSPDNKNEEQKNENVDCAKDRLRGPPVTELMQGISSEKAEPKKAEKLDGKSCITSEGRNEETMESIENVKAVTSIEDEAQENNNLEPSFINKVEEMCFQKGDKPGTFKEVSETMPYDILNRNQKEVYKQNEISNLEKIVTINSNLDEKGLDNRKDEANPDDEHPKQNSVTEDKQRMEKLERPVDLGSEKIFASASSRHTKTSTNLEEHKSDRVYQDILKQGRDKRICNDDINRKITEEKNTLSVDSNKRVESAEVKTANDSDVANPSVEETVQEQSEIPNQEENHTSEVYEKGKCSVSEQPSEMTVYMGLPSTTCKIDVDILRKVSEVHYEENSQLRDDGHSKENHIQQKDEAFLSELRSITVKRDENEKTAKGDKSDEYSSTKCIKEEAAQTKSQKDQYMQRTSEEEAAELEGDNSKRKGNDISGIDIQTIKRKVYDDPHIAVTDEDISRQIMESRSFAEEIVIWCQDVETEADKAKTEIRKELQTDSRVQDAEKHILVREKGIYDQPLPFLCEETRKESAEEEEIKTKSCEQEMHENFQRADGIQDIGIQIRREDDATIDKNAAQEKRKEGSSKEENEKKEEEIEKEDKSLDEPVNKALSELYPEGKDEPRADQPFETIMSLRGKETTNVASNVDVENVKDDGEDNAEPIEGDRFLGSHTVDKVAREINRTAPKDDDAQILDQMKDTSVNESLGENKLEDQHDEVAATNQSPSGGNQNGSFKNENGETMTKKTEFECYQNNAESPETTSGQYTGVAEQKDDKHPEQTSEPGDEPRMEKLDRPVDVGYEKIFALASGQCTKTTHLEEWRSIKGDQEIVEKEKDKTIYTDEVNRKITEEKNILEVDLNEKAESAKVKIANKDANDSDVANPSVEETVQEQGEVPNEEEKHTSEACETGKCPVSKHRDKKTLCMGLASTICEMDQHTLEKGSKACTEENSQVRDDWHSKENDIQQKDRDFDSELQSISDKGDEKEKTAIKGDEAKNSSSIYNKEEADQTKSQNDQYIQGVSKETAAKLTGDQSNIKGHEISGINIQTVKIEKYKNPHVDIRDEDIKRQIMESKSFAEEIVMCCQDIHTEADETITKIKRELQTHSGGDDAEKHILVEEKRISGQAFPFIKEETIRESTEEEEIMTKSCKEEVRVNLQRADGIQDIGIQIIGEDDATTNKNATKETRKEDSSKDEKETKEETKTSETGCMEQKYENMSSNETESKTQKCEEKPNEGHLKQTITGALKEEAEKENHGLGENSSLMPEVFGKETTEETLNKAEPTFTVATEGATLDKIDQEIKMDSSDSDSREMDLVAVKSSESGSEDTDSRSIHANVSDLSDKNKEISVAEENEVEVIEEKIKHETHGMLKIKNEIEVVTMEASLHETLEQNIKESCILLSKETNLIGVVEIDNENSKKADASCKETETPSVKEQDKPIYPRDDGHIQLAPVEKESAKQEVHDEDQEPGSPPAPKTEKVLSEPEPLELLKWEKASEVAYCSKNVKTSKDEETLNIVLEKVKTEDEKIVDETFNCDRTSHTHRDSEKTILEEEEHPGSLESSLGKGEEVDKAEDELKAEDRSHGIEDPEEKCISNHIEKDLEPVESHEQLASVLVTEDQSNRKLPEANKIENNEERKSVKDQEIETTEEKIIEQNFQGCQSEMSTEMEPKLENTEQTNEKQENNMIEKDSIKTDKVPVGIAGTDKSNNIKEQTEEGEIVGQESQGGQGHTDDSAESKLRAGDQLTIVQDFTEDANLIKKVSEEAEKGHENVSHRKLIEEESCTSEFQSITAADGAVHEVKDTDATPSKNSEETTSDENIERVKLQVAEDQDCESEEFPILKASEEEIEGSAKLADVTSSVNEASEENMESKDNCSDNTDVVPRTPMKEMKSEDIQLDHNSVNASIITSHTKNGESVETTYTGKWVEELTREKLDRTSRAISQLQGVDLDDANKGQATFKEPAEDDVEETKTSDTISKSKDQNAEEIHESGEIQNMEKADTDETKRKTSKAAKTISEPIYQSVEAVVEGDIIPEQNFSAANLTEELKERSTESLSKEQGNETSTMIENIGDDSIKKDEILGNESLEASFERSTTEKASLLHKDPKMHVVSKSELRTTEEIQSHTPNISPMIRRIAAEESLAMHNQENGSFSDSPSECETNIEPKEAIQHFKDQDTEVIEETMIGQNLQGHQVETSTEREPKQDTKEQTNEKQENNVIIKDFALIEKANQIKADEEKIIGEAFQCDQSQTDDSVEPKLGKEDRITKLQDHKSTHDSDLIEKVPEMANKGDENDNRKLNEEEIFEKELQSTSAAYGTVHEVKDMDTTPVRISKAYSDQNEGRVKSHVAENLNCESEASAILKALEEDIKEGSEKLVDVNRSVNEAPAKRNKEENIETKDICCDSYNVAQRTMPSKEMSSMDIQLDAKSVIAFTITSDTKSSESIESTYIGPRIEEVTREKFEETSGPVSPPQTVELDDTNKGTATSKEPDVDEVEETKTSDTVFKSKDQNVEEIHESEEIQNMEKAGTDETERKISKAVDTISKPIYQSVEAVGEGDIIPEQNFSAAKLTEELQETSTKSLSKEQANKTSTMIQNIRDDSIKKDEISGNECLEASFERSTAEKACLQHEEPEMHVVSKSELRPTEDAQNHTPNTSLVIKSIATEESLAVGTQEYGSEVQFSDSPSECEKNIKPKEAIQHLKDWGTEAIEETIIGQNLPGHQVEMNTEREPKQEAKEQTNKKQESNVIMKDDFTLTEEVPTRVEGTDEGENIQKQTDEEKMIGQKFQSELKLGAEDQINSVQDFKSIKDANLTEKMRVRAEQGDENVNNRKLTKEESFTKELQNIAATYGSIHEVKKMDVIPVRNSDTTNSDQNLGRVKSHVLEDHICESEASPTLKPSREEIESPKKLIDAPSSINEASEDKIKEENVENKDIWWGNTDAAPIMLMEEEIISKEIQLNAKSVSASTINSEIKIRENVVSTYSDPQVEEVTREKPEEIFGPVSHLGTVAIKDAKMWTTTFVEPAQDEVEETKTSDTEYQHKDQEVEEIHELREILDKDKIDTNKTEKEASNIGETGSGPIYQIVEAMVEGDIIPEQVFSTAKSREKHLETSNESLLMKQDPSTSTITEKIGDDHIKKDEILVNESLEPSFDKGTTEKTCLQMEKPWEPKLSKLELRPTEDVHNDGPSEARQAESIALEEASTVDTREYSSEQQFFSSQNETRMEPEEAIQCSSWEISENKDLVNLVNIKKEGNALPISHPTVQQNSPAEMGEKCKEASNFQMEKTGKFVEAFIKSEKGEITEACFQAAMTELKAEESHCGKTEVNETINNLISREKMEELKEVAKDSHVGSNEEDTGRQSYQEDELKAEQYPGVTTEASFETERADHIEKLSEEYEEAAAEKNIRKQITDGDMAVEGPNKDSVGDVTVGDTLPEEKVEVKNIEKAPERSDSNEQGDETKSRYTEKEIITLSKGVALTGDNLNRGNSNKDAKDLTDFHLTVREIPAGGLGKECEEVSTINLEKTEPSLEVFTGLGETETKEEQHHETVITDLRNDEIKNKKTYQENEAIKNEISSEQTTGEMEITKHSISGSPEEERFRKSCQEDGSKRKEIQAERTKEMFETTEKATESEELSNSETLMAKHDGQTKSASDKELQNTKLDLPPVQNAVVEEKPHGSVGKEVEEVSKPAATKRNHETIAEYKANKEIAKAETNKLAQHNISIISKDVLVEEQDPTAKTTRTEVKGLKLANAPEVKKREKSLENVEERASDDECKEITEFASIESAKLSLSDLLQKSKEETSRATKDLTEPREMTVKAEELQAGKVTGVEVEETRTDEDNDGEREKVKHKTADSGTGHAVIEEASRDMDVKVARKKSHNILSGVGSKVKHSISKVKKAITGKSSHPKTHSPK